MQEPSFDTRRMIDQAKTMIRSAHWRGEKIDLSIPPEIEEYRSEIDHYRKWIIEGGNSDIHLHRYAADLGLLDNMKLAQRLMGIEDRLDDLDESGAD